MRAKIPSRILSVLSMAALFLAAGNPVFGGQTTITATVSLVIPGRIETRTSNLTQNIGKTKNEGNPSKATAQIAAADPKKDEEVVQSDEKGFRENEDGEQQAILYHSTYNK